MFGGSHLYPRIAGKRGVLGVSTFTPLAGKKGLEKGPIRSYPYRPSSHSSPQLLNPKPDAEYHSSS